MVAIPTERARRRRSSRPALRVVPPTGSPVLVRADALPEHTDYRDTGCEVSPSCLRCPLPRCKYDAPPVSARRLTVARRDREIVLLRRKYNAPVDLLAATYGLTRRHVFRILSASRPATPHRRADDAPAATTATPTAPSASPAARRSRR